MKPKVGTLYLDFMRIMPVFTHFLKPHKLAGQFVFLKNPILYNKEYLEQITDKKTKLRFIHHLGAFKHLSKNKWRYSFWRNLFGGTSLNSYIKYYLDNDFGYLPYFVPSSWKITIASDGVNNQRIRQLLSHAKMTLSVRLFPMGAASLHFMTFFHSEQSNFTDFVDIQKILLDYRLFRITRNQSERAQLFTLNEVFEEAQKLLYNSLFTESPNGEIETKPSEIHRIIYLHLLQTNELKKNEIHNAAASLIGPKIVQTQQEGKTFLKHTYTCVEEDDPTSPHCSGDLLIFNKKATLFYTPNLNPHKEGYCLWNNYLNVVEMATLQNFVIKKANHLLDRAISPNAKFTKFSEYAPYLKELANTHRCLRGGHKRLWKEIDQNLNIANKLKDFKQLLKIQTTYKAYETIKQQIQNIEASLNKIKQMADTIQFNPILLIIVDILLDETCDTINSLSIYTKTLREIDYRKRRGNELDNDANEKSIAKKISSNNISKYRKEILPRFEYILGEFLDRAKANKINVREIREKLKEANRMPGRAHLDYTFGSATAFVNETSEYVETILKLSSEGLKKVCKNQEP
jgi:hypothetical protein